MSAGNILNTAPYTICLDESLLISKQASITALLALLPATCIHHIEPTHKQGLLIKNIVDGRGLACPMPLLKTKVALREVALNESLYVIATDPNSQADIVAFCRQTLQMDNAPRLLLQLNQATSYQRKQPPLENTTPKAFDTIFHFIITKIDSN